MKAVVLGIGMIGGMITKELSKSSLFDTVLAVDGNKEAVDKIIAGSANNKVQGLIASLDDIDVLEEILKNADVAVSALPHSLSLLANKAAIKSKCHLIDLVGSRYNEKADLNSEARQNGVLLVPGLGVAPGIANVLAGRGIELMDEADEAQVICGGLPRYPEPPLWYQVLFRLESVMGLYTRPASAVINGEIVQLPALSSMEEMVFDDPVGECEAVITDAHSLGITMKGRVKNIYEKTARYKGHYDKVRILSELGFMDDKLIDVNGNQVNARQFTMSLLEPFLRGKSKEDITVLRVVVTGNKDGKSSKLQWDMVDLYDHEREYTSMAKTTGFPAVIAAEWIAEGKITESGVVAPELLLTGERFEPFMKELQNRGIDINFVEVK